MLQVLNILFKKINSQKCLVVLPNSLLSVLWMHTLSAHPKQTLQTESEFLKFVVPSDAVTRTPPQSRSDCSLSLHPSRRVTQSLVLHPIPSTSHLTSFPPAHLIP